MFTLFKQKRREPVFLKTDSTAELQLQALLDLREALEPNLPAGLEQEIKFVKAGIAGERNIAFELENSHMPLYILHDLYLELGSLTAQIDYLIFTQSHIFVLECKNLFGNIEINESGDFIRSFYVGGKTVREGIYSPVTQNIRHMELIKGMLTAGKSAREVKSLERSFDQIYRSVIVLANPKTVLDARYAPAEVKRQVIRADQLITYMKQADAGSETVFPDRDRQRMAQLFLDYHLPQDTDYLERYRQEYRAVTAAPSENKFRQAIKSTAPQLICPLCGGVMVRRVAGRGKNAGKAFYGCSHYPECRGIVNIAEDGG